MKAQYIAVTEAHHGDDAFYELGGAGWDTAPETRTAFAAIPAAETVEGAEADYIADLLGSDGATILADKPISAETAARLIGRPIEAAREDAKVALAAELAA